MLTFEPKRKEVARGWRRLHNEELRNFFPSKVKVKLSLCLTKHQTMKTYWGNGGIAQLNL